MFIILSLAVIVLSFAIVIDARRDAYNKARKSLQYYSDDSHFH